LPTALLKLAAVVAQPLATLDASDDPLRIELELTIRLCLRVRRLLRIRFLALALALSLPEELTPTLRRAQLLGSSSPRASPKR